MSSAAVLESIFLKKMDLTYKKKADFFSSQNSSRQAFILASRTATQIERVRWKAVEQRNHFISKVLDPLFHALAKACPASAEIKNVPGWGNGVITYERHEEGAISFQWQDTAPRKQKIVMAYVLAERRLALLNGRLFFMDDLLSWKMFPQYGLEYGGCAGLTRYIVNGRSYIAQRTPRGFSSDRQAMMYAYSKFSYPGWEETDVYREVQL